MTKQANLHSKTDWVDEGLLKQSDFIFATRTILQQGENPKVSGSGLGLDTYIAMASTVCIVAVGVTRIWCLGCSGSTEGKK